MSGFASGFKTLIRSAKKAVSSSDSRAAKEEKAAKAKAAAPAEEAANDVPDARPAPPVLREGEAARVSAVHCVVGEYEAQGTPQAKWAALCNVAGAVAGWRDPSDGASLPPPELPRRPFRVAFPDDGKGLADSIGRVYAAQVRETLRGIEEAKPRRGSPRKAPPPEAPGTESPVDVAAALVTSREFHAACALTQYLAVYAPAASSFASTNIPSLLVSLLHDVAQQVVMAARPASPEGTPPPRDREADGTALDAAMTGVFFPAVAALLSHEEAADDLVRTGRVAMLFEAYGLVLKAHPQWADGCGHALSVCGRASLPHLVALSPITSLLDFLSAAMPNDPTLPLSPFTASPSPPMHRPGGAAIAVDAASPAARTNQPTDVAAALAHFPSPSPLKEMAPPQTTPPVPGCISVLKVLASLAEGLDPAQGTAHIEQLVLFNTIGVKMCARTAAWCDGLDEGEAVAVFAKMITVSPCTGPTAQDMNELSAGACDGGHSAPQRTSAIFTPGSTNATALARNGFVFAELPQLALACRSPAAQQRAAEAVMQIYAAHPDNYMRLKKYSALAKFIQDMPGLHHDAQISVIQVLQFVVQQLNHRPEGAISSVVQKIGDDLPARVTAALLRMLCEFIRLDPTFRATLRDVGAAQACLRYFKTLSSVDSAVGKAVGEEEVRCVDAAVDFLLLMAKGGGDHTADGLRKLPQAVIDGALGCAQHPEPGVALAMERLLLHLTLQDAAVEGHAAAGVVEALLHVLSKTANAAKTVDWPSVTVVLAVLLKASSSLPPHSPFFARCLAARGVRAVHSVLKCVLEFLDGEKASPESYHQRRASVVSLHELDDPTAPLPRAAADGRECTTSARFLMVTRLGWAVVASISVRCPGELNSVAATTVKALRAAGGACLAYADLLRGAVGHWAAGATQDALTSYNTTQQLLLRLMKAQPEGQGDVVPPAGEGAVTFLGFKEMLVGVEGPVVFPGALSAAVQLLPVLPDGDLTIALGALAGVARDVPLIIPNDVAALTAVVDIAERAWRAAEEGEGRVDLAVFDHALPNVLSSWSQPTALRRLASLPSNVTGSLSQAARCVLGLAVPCRPNRIAFHAEGSSLSSKANPAVSWPPPHGFACSVWFRYTAGGGEGDGAVLLRVSWQEGGDGREMFYQVGVDAEGAVVASSYAEADGVQHTAVPDLRLEPGRDYHLLWSHMPPKDGIIKNKASEVQVHIDGVVAERGLALPYPAAAPGGNSAVAFACGLGRPRAAAPFAGGAGGSLAHSGSLAVSQLRVMAGVPTDAAAVVMASLGPGHTIGYECVNPAATLTAAHLTSRARAVLDAAQLEFIAHAVGTLPESWSEYPFGPSPYPAPEDVMWAAVPSGGADQAAPAATTSRGKACEARAVGSVCCRVWTAPGGSVAVTAAQRGVAHTLLSWASEGEVLGHGPPTDEGMYRAVLTALALLRTVADVDTTTAADAAVFNAIAALLKQHPQLITCELLEQLFNTAVQRSVVRSIPAVRYVLLDQEVWRGVDDAFSLTIYTNLARVVEADSGYVAFNAARLQKGADLTRAVLLRLAGTPGHAPSKALMEALVTLLRRHLLVLAVDQPLLQVCLADVARFITALVRRDAPPPVQGAPACEEIPAAHRVVVAARLLDLLLGLVEEDWYQQQTALRDSIAPGGDADPSLFSIAGAVSPRRGLTSGFYHGRPQGLAQQAQAAFGGVVSEISDTAADVVKSVVSSLPAAAQVGAAAVGARGRPAAAAPGLAPAARGVIILKVLAQCIDRAAWVSYVVHHAGHPALVVLALRVLAALLRTTPSDAPQKQAPGRVYDADKCHALLKDPQVVDVLADAVRLYPNQPDVFHLVLALACDRAADANTTVTSMALKERGAWGTRWTNAVGADVHGFPLFRSFGRVAFTLLRAGVALTAQTPDLPSPNATSTNSAEPSACFPTTLSVSGYLAHIATGLPAAQRRWRTLRVRTLCLTALAERLGMRGCLRVAAAPEAAPAPAGPADGALREVVEGAERCVEAALRSASRLQQYVQDDALLRLSAESLLVSLPRGLVAEAAGIDERHRLHAARQGTGATVKTDVIDTHDDELEALLGTTAEGAAVKSVHREDGAETPTGEDPGAADDAAGGVSDGEGSDSNISFHSIGDLDGSSVKMGKVGGGSFVPSTGSAPQNGQENDWNPESPQEGIGREQTGDSWLMATVSYRDNSVFHGAEEAAFRVLQEQLEAAMQGSGILALLARAVQYAVLCDLPWRSLPCSGGKAKRSSDRKASPATQVLNRLMYLIPSDTPRAVRIAYHSALVKAAFKAVQDRLSFVISDAGSLANLINMLSFLATRLYGGYSTPVEDLMNMGKDVLNALECRNLRPPVALWGEFSNRIAVWLLSPDRHSNFVVTTSGLDRAGAHYELEAFLSSLALVFHQANGDVVFLQQMLLTLMERMGPEKQLDDARKDKIVAALRLLIAAAKRSPTLMSELFVASSKRNFYAEAFECIDGTPHGNDTFKLWLEEQENFAAMREFFLRRHGRAHRKALRQEDKCRAWLVQVVQAAVDSARDRAAAVDNKGKARAYLDAAVDPGAELLHPVVLKHPLSAGAYLRGFPAVVLPPHVLSRSVAWPMRSAGADVPPLAVPSDYPRAAVPLSPAAVAPADAESPHHGFARAPGHDGGFEELKKVEHPKYRHSCMAASDDGTIPLAMLVHATPYRLPAQALPKPADGLAPTASWLCSVIMERFQDTLKAVHEVWRVWYLESIPSMVIVGQHSLYIVSHVRRTESGGVQYCPAKISREKGMQAQQGTNDSSPLQSPGAADGKHKEKSFPAFGALARGLRGIARPRSDRSKHTDEEPAHRLLLSLTLVHLSSEAGVVQVPLSALTEPIPRMTHHEDVALEVTTETRRSFLFTVMNRAGVMSAAARKRLYDDLRQAAPHAATPGAAATLEDLVQLWKKRVLSNFDYLMAVNALAGRTTSDLNQYPVVPWVLADYRSDAVDLSDAQVFRDLSKPMGALDAKRAASFEDRYEGWDDWEVPKFHYGSHYSTAMMVLWFLTRLQPHTSMAVVYQGGKLDLADRLFNAVADAWHSASSGSNTDIKELVPEFYTLPECLTNTNHLCLGANRDGHELGDVVLPKWATSAEHFIEMQRRAMESEHVSAHIHLWIDLIFGVASRGEEAQHRLNVFYHLTYPGRLPQIFNSLETEGEKWAAATQVSQFGQTPKQLLSSAHPARATPAHITLNVTTDIEALLAACEVIHPSPPPSFYAYSPTKSFEHSSTLACCVGAGSGAGVAGDTVAPLLLSPGLAPVGNGAAYVDTTYRDGYARVYAVGDGALVATLVLPAGAKGGTAVASLPMSFVVFLGTSQGVLAMALVVDPPVQASQHVWTAATAPQVQRLVPLYRLVAHWGPVSTVLHVPNTALLLTASNDGGHPVAWTVGPRQGVYCASMGYHEGPLHDAKYMHSRRWLYTCSADCVHVAAMHDLAHALYTIRVPEASPTAGAVFTVLPVELPEREDRVPLLLGHTSGKVTVWALRTSEVGAIEDAVLEHTLSAGTCVGPVCALLQRPRPFQRATSGYYYQTVAAEGFASFHKLPLFYSAHVGGQVLQWGLRKDGKE